MEAENIPPQSSPQYTEENVSPLAVASPVKKGGRSSLKQFILFLALLTFAFCFLTGIIPALVVGFVVNKVRDNFAIEMATKETNAWSNPMSVGEAVLVGDIVWTVTKAEDLGNRLPSQYPTLKPDCILDTGRFVKVYFKIQNVGFKDRQFDAIELYDSNKKYLAFSGTARYSSCEIPGEEPGIEILNPGVGKSYATVFEVATTSTGLRIKVNDLDPGGLEVHYILLGL